MSCSVSPAGAWRLTGGTGRFSGRALARGAVAIFAGVAAVVAGRDAALCDRDRNRNLIKSAIGPIRPGLEEGTRGATAVPGRPERWGA